MDILYPRPFPSNPKRLEATRTIAQPEDDLFEQAQALAIDGNPGSLAHIVTSRAAVLRGVA
ncbi:MAG: hypothetical protein D4S02_01730 [Rhodocyclaceae bacterium]|nr:MAG: hypothetical protein D4S02_01730 [Rhodocyclaceae bacterium]